MSTSYDVKCYELAKAFLKDHPDPGMQRDDCAEELAGMIQDVIDDYMTQWD